MREPAVAGMFYPAVARKLEREIRECFIKGPGRDKPQAGPPVSGIVAPHAGYVYSGPCAAFSFLKAADGGLPPTAVVIGPNHTGLGKDIGVSREDFRTPLGVMRNDGELSDAMGHHDELSHLREHSMEVQLPFLQYLSPDMKQVCISVGYRGPSGNGASEDELFLQQAGEVSDMILDALFRTGKRALIVASSDFTHCGWNYGQPVPSGMNAGEFARSVDLPVIDLLLKGDLQGALKTKRELGATPCGMVPILSMIMTVRKLGKGHLELLDYRTSYDVSPSHSAVGYASIAYIS